MVDIPRHVAHWQKGAEEDWAAATVLVERGHVRHGLFFAHLALEKALKAHVCRRTGDLAPRTHNLVRLAGLAGTEPSSEQLDVLADINRFNMVGR
ncbi:MAG: HEPN domain-containing protein, partial [Planctomycetes bacterium]|nr:HEPN domain-containing protein [Planctomycetota bacterium]